MTPFRRMGLSAKARRAGAVCVVRISARRRAGAARAMARAGWPHCRIRAALGLSPAALARALEDFGGVWSAREREHMRALGAEVATCV